MIAIIVVTLLIVVISLLLSFFYLNPQVYSLLPFQFSSPLSWWVESEHLYDV